MTDKEFAEAMKSLTDDERKMVTRLWHNGGTLEEAIKRVTFPKTHVILGDLSDSDNNDRENEIRKETAKEILQALRPFTSFTEAEYKEIAKKYGVEVDDE